MSKEHESESLLRQANDQRSRSQRLRQGMSQDMPEDDRRQREHEAGKAEERATELEGRANALKHRGGVGEKEEAERAPERRAWAHVGTLAEGDKLQQVAEAGSSNGLMGSLMAYSARSMVTRDGKGFQATATAAQKLVGRSGKNTAERSPGSGVMDEVRQHKAGRGQGAQQRTHKRPERQQQRSSDSKGRER